MKTLPEKLELNPYPSSGKVGILELSTVTRKINEIIDYLAADTGAANYNHRSHEHCWAQKQPSACGIPLEKHTQCCLCDLVPPREDMHALVRKLLERVREEEREAMVDLFDETINEAIEAARKGEKK